MAITSQAAEGLMRRRWTIAEIEAAAAAGIIDDDERFELIGGELVPMSAKGIRHEIIKAGLGFHFAKSLPNDLRFAVATTFRLTEDTFLEPDLVFFQRSDGIPNLGARTALLVLEVADSSLEWDLGRKARIYADFGIPELWVIDARSRVTHVHRQPRLEGYSDVRQYAENQRIVSAHISSVAFTLSELEAI